MVLVAPLLFLDPVTQVQELHRVFVDEIASSARWNALNSKLKGQLQDSNLLVNLPFIVVLGTMNVEPFGRPLSYSISMLGFSLSTLLIRAGNLPFRWQVTCPWWRAWEV
jgi:hypothetical protein